MDTNATKMPLMTRVGQWFKRGKAVTPVSGGAGTGLAGAIRLVLWVFAALVVVYVLSVLNLGRTVRNASTAIEVASNLRLVEKNIVELRRTEQDFFDRLSLEDLDRHKQKFEETEQLIQSIFDNPQFAQDERDALKSITEDIKQYRSSFVEAAEQQVRVGLNENQGIQGQMRKAAHETEQAISAIGSKDMMVNYLELRRSEKDYLFRNQEQYAAQFDKSFKDLLGVVGKLDAGNQTKIGTSLVAYEKAFKDLMATVRGVNRPKIAARASAMAAEQGIPDLVEKNTEGRRAATAAVLIQLGISSVVLVLTLAGLSILLLRARKSADATLHERAQAQMRAETENENLNNSVISILQAVNQLSQKDLTVRAPVTQDVIGTVSDSINLLTDETSRVLQDVTGIAGQVQTASGKVKSQADVVSQTAESERQSVQQMVESLLDATQTMNQVAALAEQSNESAGQATVVTDNALETVNGTVRGMESIRETIAETEKRIKRLGERSQEISGIVNLINTISERTHVLALNASMQAAVAGEAGRGFAVVAEEVQRLAESSRNATQQIATLVNNIQLETNETISTVNRTIGQVVQGSEQAQKAGEQMRQTQQITSQLVSQVRSIAHASEQQKTMSAQLLGAVQRIGESTEHTARQIDAQNQETDTLLDASRRLVESVAVFKLPQAA